MKVGIEIGGTFTDVLAISREGAIVDELKVPSTPKEPERAVLTALAELSKKYGQIDMLAHGSTVATNAVLERKGGPIGLLVTEGFGDLLEIQRHDRYDIYDLRYQRPKPLVSRDHVMEVNERTETDGETSRELSEAEITTALDALSERDIRSIAITFLHSYANPENERRVKRLVENRYPGVEVTLSSDILPEFREYERASTTCLSAYVMPLVNRYLLRIEQGMADYQCRDLWMMQSNGGALPASMAREHGVRTILSGPAAGVAGAYHGAKEAGFDKVITFDMGGTSADVSLIHEGQPEVTTESKIDGLPIRIPMLDIISIGAGGGSTAWIDSQGMLHVGPQSQGADPGPASYLKGGNLPTVTDANVFLGLIRPDHFLGGRMKLGVKEAQAVIEEFAEKMGRDPHWVADGIIRVVCNNMALAVRLISTERGHDPKDYALVAFGGAGPLECAFMAEELGMDTILVPRYPGLLSAFGLLVSDFKRDYVLSRINKLDDMNLENMNVVFSGMEERAIEELKTFNMDAADLQRLELRRFVDMRYKGQAYELTLRFVDSEVQGNLETLKVAFNQTHQDKYGYADTKQDLEIVNYRLEAIIPQGQPVSPRALSNASSVTPKGEKNRVYINGTLRDCVFYNRDELPVGFTFTGPAVVEEHTATTLVPPGWKGSIDEHNNIIIRKEGHSDEN